MIPAPWMAGRLDETQSKRGYRIVGPDQRQIAKLPYLPTPSIIASALRQFMAPLSSTPSVSGSATILSLASLQLFRRKGQRIDVAIAKSAFAEPTCWASSNQTGAYKAIAVVRWVQWHATICLGLIFFGSYNICEAHTS